MPTGKHVVEFDNEQQLVDSADNAIRVKSVSGGGGAAQADRSSFTDGGGILTPVGGVLNDTPVAPTEDQVAALRITAQRAAHVNLRNNGGTEVGTAAEPLFVFGSVEGDVTHDLPDGGQPVKIGAVARVGVPIAVGEGDRVNLIADLYGRLKGAVGGDQAHDDAEAATSNPVKIGGVAFATANLPGPVADGDRVQATLDPYGLARCIVTGPRQHDFPDLGAYAGAPVKIGGIARSILPSQVANNDVTNLIADLFGRLLTVSRRSSRKTSGVYHYQTGVHLVLASADTATAGRWFLVNTSSVVKVALRSVRFLSQLGSALNTPTSPRIQLELFSFTGTPSGATITPAKRRSTESANTATLRTANTGMTITSGAAIYAFLPVASATAAGYNTPAAAEWFPVEDEEIILGQNEGVLLRQPDAGTSSDTRRYVTSLVVEEFTDT